MIRAALPRARGDALDPAPNGLRGEFAGVIAGESRRFDTRLATVAAIEEACGDRPIAEVLNGVVLGRRARDLMPLIEAALRAADPGCPDPGAVAARTSVEEAEAFVLALILALGFTVGERREDPDARPLDGGPHGGAGASSPSAA